MKPDPAALTLAAPLCPRTPRLGLAGGGWMATAGRLRPRKRPVSHPAMSALMQVPRLEIDLGRSRPETPCLIVTGMVSARGVHLGHLACERPGSVRTASSGRRLQRFFRRVQFDADRALPLLVRLPGLNGAWLLALDRTNRQIGRTEVNHPAPAVVTRRFRVPLGCPWRGVWGPLA